MAIQDMFPTQGAPTPAANPTYNAGGVSKPGPNFWGNIMNAYGAYKDRDTQSDAAKNLSKGYTSAEQALTQQLGPYAQRGDEASNTYLDLANQYQPGAGPGLEGSNFEQFDPSQLRDPEYLRNTPGYQFRYEEGKATRENAAASRGLNLSTNIVRDLDKYGQDMASQEYEKEYDRLADMYRVNRETDSANYRSGEEAKLGNWKADQQSQAQQMQNYTPLMNQGYGAATNIGTGHANLEVARGGAAATREQNQGTISNQFLGSITPGSPGQGGFAEQLGIDKFSFGDVGEAFGNMQDWFTEPGSFQGDWDGFWGGVRDFELGDLEGIFSDFF